MKCSTKDCTNEAAQETLGCGHYDYFCNCEIYPLCDDCLDREMRESYEWLETLSDPGFNAFYLAHMPESEYNEDQGFYYFYIQSLVRK